MKTQLKDIYWLAGLLEGDGCFTNSGGAISIPTIIVKMTDRDTVEKAQRILRPVKFRADGNTIFEFSDPRPDRQPQFIAKIGGKRAAGWMMTLYPLMGQRRQSRIRELLTTWKSVGEI